MRSVRVSCVWVNHLLGITVICSDEQDVTGLLAGLVDRADGLVGSRDGLDRCIQDASVANLIPISVNTTPKI